MMPMDDIDALLGAIAAHGLDDSESEPRRISPTPEEWAHLRTRLAEERLTGVAALLRSRGVLELDDSSTAELAELDRVWAHHTLAAEDVLLVTARELQAKGIPLRVLKGVATAELAWRWGEARRWVDADVLVPGERMDEAVAICRARGASRPIPELRSGFDRRFAKSVTLRSAEGPEIDLHRALVVGPHGHLVPSSDLWAAPQPFVVDGLELEAMSPSAVFIHACMHATITGVARLSSLRDVVEAFEACQPAHAAALASRWKARPMVVAAAEGVATRLGLGGHRLVAWASGLEITSEERQIASVYAGPNRTERNLALASVRHIPGPFAKLRFITALALPARPNRAVRGRSLIDQVRRAARR